MVADYLNSSLVIIALLLAGCDSTKINDLSVEEKDPGSSFNFLGYQPIEPIPVDKVMLYEESTGEIKEVYWDSIADEDTIRDMLPLQSARVSISKNNTSGGVSYLTAAVSGEKGSYTVIMDYMKYRIEDVSGDNPDERIGSGRIGIGLRINYSAGNRFAAKYRPD